MKLYAKITALKLIAGKLTQVTKSQGSNTQINIEIFIDTETAPAYRLHINKRDDDTTDICLVDLSETFPKSEVYSQTKGKQQKGDS